MIRIRIKIHCIILSPHCTTCSLLQVCTGMTFYNSFWKIGTTKNFLVNTALLEMIDILQIAC